MTLLALLVVSTVELLPRTGQAPIGNALAPHTLATAWVWDFPAMLSLEVGFFLYSLGLLRLWQRAGRGRGVRVSQAAAFYAALAALVVALLSPLDALSDVLFSAHMTQHLVLVLVAAPLLAYSGLPVVLLWALPRAWARALANARGLRWVAGRLTRPVTAWVLAVVVLWAWHLPALYEAALHDTALHALEHVFFLSTAVLFWWVIVNLLRRQRRVRSGIGVIYLFTAALQGGALGALLTFASQPWYTDYTATAQWGLSAMDDQRLAGLLMWLPGGILYSLLAAILFVAWLQALEQRMNRTTRRLERGLSGRNA